MKETKASSGQSDEQMVQLVVEQMKTDPDLAGFTDDALHDLLLKLRIFQTGLSVIVAGGFLAGRLSDERAEQLLDEAALAFASFTHLNQNT